MQSNLEALARNKLSSSLTSNVKPEQLTMDENMVDTWGLTSLNKVLFITTLCREADIELSQLTEEDLAGMHTLRDVIDILTPHLP
jgi:hypothetical protein